MEVEYNEKERILKDELNKEKNETINQLKQKMEAQQQYFFI